jgi:hypothetical protein
MQQERRRKIAKKFERKNYEGKRWIGALLFIDLYKAEAMQVRRNIKLRE